MKKHLLFIALLLLLTLPTESQNLESVKAEYEKYRQEQTEEYNNYCSEANRAYAEFMAQEWEQFNAMKPQKPESRPEPPTPLLKNPEIPTTADPLPFDTIIPLAAPKPQPKPQPVITEPIPDATHERITLYFYNTPCNFTLVDTKSFEIQNCNEKEIAQQWQHLSGKQFAPLIPQAIEMREQLQLCDWAYVELTQAIAETLMGKKSNEATLLQMYLLTQSGYKVRIAKEQDKLYLLIPSSETLYGYPFIMIDNNERYYVITKGNADSYYLFDQSFPNEQELSIAMHNTPLLTYRPSKQRQYRAKAYPQLQLTLQANQNLIEFYNNYPLSNHWNLYVRSSLSPEIKNTLYPLLQQQMAGMNQADAANLLINFVQTAFEYQTDKEQFGYERPLFADETFFYPYSDCEDRAILFAILVRELLHLDVVLLNYPQHLATAVHFTEPIEGDYMTIDSKKYLVCDPTYIGASIGDAMPQLKNSSATIIKI